MVLRIKSMESDGSIYCYDYDVALEPFGEQSERYHIPIGTDASQLFLELKDKSGEVQPSSGSGRQPGCAGAVHRSPVG